MLCSKQAACHSPLFAETEIKTKTRLICHANFLQTPKNYAIPTADDLRMLRYCSPTNNNEPSRVERQQKSIFFSIFAPFNELLFRSIMQSTRARARCRAARDNHVSVGAALIWRGAIDRFHSRSDCLSNHIFCIVGHQLVSQFVNFAMWKWSFVVAVVVGAFFHFCQCETWGACGVEFFFGLKILLDETTE